MKNLMTILLILVAVVAIGCAKEEVKELKVEVEYIGPWQGIIEEGYSEGKFVSGIGGETFLMGDIEYCAAIISKTADDKQPITVRIVRYPAEGFVSPSEEILASGNTNIAYGVVTITAHNN